MKHLLVYFQDLNGEDLIPRIAATQKLLKEKSGEWDWVLLPLELQESPILKMYTNISDPSLPTIHIHIIGNSSILVQHPQLIYHQDIHELRKYLESA